MLETGVISLVRARSESSRSGPNKDRLGAVGHTDNQGIHSSREEMLQSPGSLQTWLRNDTQQTQNVQVTDVSNDWDYYLWTFKNVGNLNIYPGVDNVTEGFKETTGQSLLVGLTVM